MSEQKKLAAKLAEAVSKVGGVEKKGTNEAQRYKYVRAADVAIAMRHELFDRGIVIIPDEIECLTRQIQYKNAKGEERNSNEAIVRTAYHITDGNETLTMHGYGIAWDAGDKAIYKAKTGSLKYFLRGLGLVPDEKDDPENDAEVDKAVAEVEKSKIVNQRLADYGVDFDERTEGQRKVSKALVDALVAFANSQGISGIPSPADLLELTRDEFEDVKKQVMARAKTPATAAVMAPVASIPVQVPKAPQNGKVVSEAQLKRLFAIAKGKNVAVADVDIYIAEQYGLSSKTALSQEQYKTTISWIESQ